MTSAVPSRASGTRSDADPPPHSAAAPSGDASRARIICAVKWRSLATWLGALLLFAACLASAYSGFLGADWSRDAPRAIRGPMAVDPFLPELPALGRADYRLAVWSLARNARTLASDPLSIFEAEPCHPVRRALALHHPVISPAIVALPFWVATGDPLQTFNLGLLALTLLSALAMLVLVRDWTGSTAAGLAAGVLYAFHTTQLEKPQHFFNTDNAWLLFGLYFGRRLLAGGRWRDGLGFVASCALQAGSSFYPLLGALVLALPMGAYLLWLQGRPVDPIRLGVVLVLTMAAGGLLLGPYLVLSGDTLSTRANVFYAPWSRFAPGGSLFPGWVCLALLLVGVAVPRARAIRLARDPRPALLIGALLIAWITTGGNVIARMTAFQEGIAAPFALPNLFAWIRSVLPGAEAVRLPSALGPGVVQIAVILAGFGAAALLRGVPERARAGCGAALVAICVLDTLRPAWLGLEPPVHFGRVALRPPDATLAFHAELERVGARGPFYEIPLDRRDKGYSLVRSPLEQLLTAYHGQRTSGCYTSFLPAPVRELAKFGDLADPTVRSALRERGFETVVVHHPAGHPGLRRFARRVADQARGSGGELVPLVATAGSSAYALRAPERATP